MKVSVSHFLQEKLDKYVYLFRVSSFITNPTGFTSDITAGTIIVDISTNSILCNLCDERLPIYFSDKHLSDLKNECLNEALEVHNFINKRKQKLNL